MTAPLGSDTVTINLPRPPGVCAAPMPGTARIARTAAKLTRRAMNNTRTSPRTVGLGRNTRLEGRSIWFVGGREGRMVRAAVPIAPEGEMTGNERARVSRCGKSGQLEAATGRSFVEQCAPAEDRHVQLDRG